MQRLYFKQDLPISLDEAWDFFSNPANLSQITPKSMDFNIISGQTSEMYPGQIITYTVRPLAGIKTNWVTEISHISKPNYFIDTQLSGPYKTWHHQHFFKEIQGGVQMEDILHYEVPFGWLGDIVNRVIIRNKVKGIFEHRYNVLSNRFVNRTE